MAAMPVGEAERAGEKRRVVGVEHGRAAEMGARVDRRSTVGQRGKARRVAVEPEEQRRARRRCVPAQPTILVQHRHTIRPMQLPRVGAARELGDPVGLRAQDDRRGRGRVRRKRVQAARASAGEHRFGGAAVKGRQAGFAEPVERLPPAFALRLGSRSTTCRSSAKWVKTWRTGARAARRVGVVLPVRARAARPCRRACPWPVGEPARRAVALDPPCDAVTVRPRAFGLGRGERLRACRSRRPAVGRERAGCRRRALGRQMVAPRSIIACAKSSGAVRPGSWPRRRARISLRAWRLVGRCRGSRATTRSTLVSIDRRRLAEGDRGDGGGGIGADARAAGAGPPRLAGNRPAPRRRGRRR